MLGISFDHMHMGDLLMQVAEHPEAEIAGIYDPDRSRMEAAIARFEIPRDRVFTDLEACLSTSGADLAIVCSATAEHASSVEAIARHGLHVVVEKPFAASVADARRMINAMDAAGRRLAVNWPLAWYAGHNTAKRLVDEGALGDLVEIHYMAATAGHCSIAPRRSRFRPKRSNSRSPGPGGTRRLAAAAACATISAMPRRSAPGS